MNKGKVGVFFFSRGSDEDREAERLLKEADILCFYYLKPTSEETTPFIEWGLWKYVGIEAIKRFIEKWKRNDLPDPYDLLRLHQCTDPD